MSYETIKIKSYQDVYEEYDAVAALSPGHLVELTSAGKVQKHATQGGNALPMFAIEDALQGKGILDDFAADDKVRVWIPGRGDIVYALLADEQDVAIGAFLESNGDGTLRAHTVETWTSADAQQANTVYSNAIVGVALEAKELSSLSAAGSSDTPVRQRIKVRIV